MKILVLSDSHGNLNNLRKATEQYGRNADVLIHCGDGTRGDAQWLQDNCKHCMVVCVKGNCDFGSMLKTEEILSVDGLRILITHGDKYNVKYTLANLSYRAEENNCNLVFFGHTHVATDTLMGNVRLINPGAASYYGAGCAVVETDDKGNILVNHVKL
jgi:putative phosphoesterase